ncbi:hypothetical protein TOPH_04995, partial [Tolypocladium ophioglossoides CBS 100239]
LRVSAVPVGELSTPRFARLLSINTSKTLTIIQSEGDSEQHLTPKSPKSADSTLDEVTRNAHVTILASACTGARSLLGSKSLCHAPRHLERPTVSLASQNELCLHPAISNNGETPGTSLSPTGFIAYGSLDGPPRGIMFS